MRIGKTSLPKQIDFAIWHRLKKKELHIVYRNGAIGATAPHGVGNVNLINDTE
jgi:hypothetical protein